MCVFYMNVCLCTTCVKFPLRPEEGTRPSELEISKVVSYQCGCLEPNAVSARAANALGAEGSSQSLLLRLSHKLLSHQYSILTFPFTYNTWLSSGLYLLQHILNSK